MFAGTAPPAAPIWGPRRGPRVPAAAERPNPVGCGLPRLNSVRARARRRPHGRGVVRVDRALVGSGQGEVPRRGHHPGESSGSGRVIRASRGTRALREAPGARTRGPTQRVPKNTPDASRTSRPFSVPFNRTARPEGFAIRYSVRPQGSGLVRITRPEGFAIQRAVPPERAFRLTRSRPRRIRTRDSRLTDAPLAAIIKFARRANSCG